MEKKSDAKGRFGAENSPPTKDEYFQERLREKLKEILKKKYGGIRGKLAKDLNVPPDNLSQFLGSLRGGDERKRPPTPLSFDVGSLFRLHNLLQGGLGALGQGRPLVEELSDGQKITVVIAGKSEGRSDHFSAWDVKGTARLTNAISRHSGRSGAAGPFEIKNVVLPRHLADRETMVTQWRRTLKNSNKYGHTIILGSERANPVASAALRVLFGDLPLLPVSEEHSQLPEGEALLHQKLPKFRLRWHAQEKRTGGAAHPESPWGYFGGQERALEVFGEGRRILAPMSDRYEYGLLCAGIVSSGRGGPRLVIVAQGLSGPGTFAACEMFDQFLQLDMVPKEPLLSFVEAKIARRSDGEGDARNLGKHWFVKPDFDNDKLVASDS